jgi:hypothetical protein
MEYDSHWLVGWTPKKTPPYKINMKSIRVTSAAVYSIRTVGRLEGLVFRP